MNIIPVPAQSFCKKLKKLDPDLQLNFASEIGLWQIWYKNKITGELNFVMNVVNEDGSYRPLDQRTIGILGMNSYYANNPKELEEIMVDDLVDKIDHDKDRTHKEMGYFAKDRTLNKKFKEAQEKAQKIRWEDWQRPHQFSTGEVYKPHSTIVGQSKPTI